MPNKKTDDGGADTGAGADGDSSIFVSLFMARLDIALVHVRTVKSRIVRQFYIANENDKIQLNKRANTKQIFTRQPASI